MARQLHGVWIAVATWVIFFAAYTLEMFLDWHLRMANGNVQHGGLARATWFAVHAGLALAAVGGLVFAARRLRWPLAALAVTTQVALGAVLYLVGCLAYGIGSGIDHF